MKTLAVLSYIVIALVTYFFNRAMKKTNASNEEKNRIHILFFIIFFLSIFWTCVAMFDL